MKTNFARFCRLAVLAAASVLSACAVSSPATRIAQYPGMYSGLPAAHQELVQTGRIAEGMNRDAVFLAWGRPDNVSAGREKSQPLELWRYTSLQPICRNYIGMGYGYGYGPYRGHGHHHYHHEFIDVGPDYVPITSGVVKFRSGKVSAWETLR